MISILKLKLKCKRIQDTADVQWQGVLLLLLNVPPLHKELVKTIKECRTDDILGRPRRTPRFTWSNM